MTVFLYAGNGPYANRGCEAIVRGTTQVLRQIEPQARFVSSYFSRQACDDHVHESDSSIEHQPIPWLKPYTRPWFKEQIQRRLLGKPMYTTAVEQTLRPTLKTAQIVFMLGGDNYTLDYGSHDIFFHMNDLCLTADLPVVMWGVSVGPFDRDPRLEQWVAQELRRVTLICARETETVAYLASIGVQENVLLTADPAFHLHTEPVVLPAHLETALQEGAIGLNLSPLLHRFLPTELEKQGDTYQRWVYVAAQIIDELCQQVSQKIVLMPHVRSYTNERERDDLLFMKQVWTQIKQKEQVLVMDVTANAAQSKWIISRFLVFAGARTHSTFAAISAGVPTICIGYSMKARGVAQDVYGHQHWLVDTARLVKEPALLAALMTELITQEMDIRRHLVVQVPVFQQKVVKAAQQTVALLGS